MLPPSPPDGMKSLECINLFDVVILSILSCQLWGRMCTLVEFTSLAGLVSAVPVEAIELAGVRVVCVHQERLGGPTLSPQSITVDGVSVHVYCKLFTGFS